jgi:hypothetical protein
MTAMVTFPQLYFPSIPRGFGLKIWGTFPYEKRTNSLYNSSDRRESPLQPPRMRPTKMLPVCGSLREFHERDSSCQGLQTQPRQTDLSLEKFERGEIVSPVGCIARKVSGFNLAMPDARHRRPLKFLFTLYYQSGNSNTRAKRHGIGSSNRTKSTTKRLSRMT